MTFSNLSLPLIVSPMFLISGPDLVVEVCKSGAVGTFPSLNQRTNKGFRDWLEEIEARLAETRGSSAPFGVNLIVHESNYRLADDLDAVIEHKVPLVITSLGINRAMVERIQSYGGKVFHDVINVRHARKAAAEGVDGIIAVTAGAGGHAGSISPFALTAEIRDFFDGVLVLSGAMTNGQQIAAARMMGADMAYIGTRFINTTESMAVKRYKDMLIECNAADILYTSEVSGVNANFLRPSLVAAGLDPENLKFAGKIDLGPDEAKLWKDMWSAGHGVGSIDDVVPASALCTRLTREYRAALHASQSLLAEIPDLTKLP